MFADISDASDAPLRGPERRVTGKVDRYTRLVHPSGWQGVG